VDKVELFAGGIAEDHVEGSSLGATFQAIIANQFQRTRDGDRLWYQNVFSGFQLRALESTRLSGIIRANTDIKNIQNNVFFFRVAISGTVSASSGGRFDRGLAGQTVNLLSAEDGSLLATTQTNERGRYSFNFDDGLELGDYQIQLVAEYRGEQVTKLSRTISITRGDQFVAGVDFVLGTGGGDGYVGNDQCFDDYFAWHAAQGGDGWDRAWR
jgi:hypothetical protein